MGKPLIHLKQFKAVALCVTTGLLLLPASLVAQDSYSITKLGALRGGSGVPRAANAGGQVIGRSGEPHGSMTTAFLWNSHSRIQTLGTLGGGEYSAAFGINNAGQVVGSSNTETALRPFLWTSGGGMQDLGTLAGATDGEAFGINNFGQVVGYSSGPEGVRAVMWSGGMGPRDLGLATPSEALSVNDLGHVAGNAGLDGSISAFLIGSSGVPQSLGTLADVGACEAQLVNNSDQVVGFCTGDQGTQAFIWDRSAGMQGLGMLPGGDFSQASGINNTGVVVGSSGSSLGTHAFVWTPALGMQDLNGLIPTHPEIVFSGAVGVNDLGQIVAFGTLGRGANHKLRVDLDHDSHAGPLYMFLLTPIGASAPR